MSTKKGGETKMEEQEKKINIFLSITWIFFPKKKKMVILKESIRMKTNIIGEFFFFFFK